MPCSTGPRAFLLLLALALPARAELPLPLYPECGEPDRPDLCPPDLREAWALISYIPASARDSVREEELDVGSGCHADRAWRLATGRFDIPIAVLDSGIEWQSNHLARKVRIHTGELPPPIGPDGEEVPSYDVDGNGLVNVTDWSWDPRVDPTAGRDAADGILDPSDLLYTSWGPAWDGVDNDGNGYIDDIAGWDFFGDDNDPWADWEAEFGTHGSGVAEEAAAEGGDAWDGTIGVCPGCSILPVRVGDSFITDGNRVAMAMAYAADNGARVLSMAIGALSNPEIADQALERCRERGVVVVTAAGDENSFHPNYPGVRASTLVVHSVRANNQDEDGSPFTYQNFFNCNNFGPRLFLVATNNACATGAVAVTAGASGLILSAARDQGMELEPEELRGLLSATADDIWLSEADLARARTYPSGEGWDPFYGYGKINVGRAVEWVVRGEIPPLVDLEGPEWFDVIDPTSAEDLAVMARVAVPRAGSVSWVLEQGEGLDPRDWSLLASGSGPVEGEIGAIDPGLLSAEALAPVFDAPAGETVVERAERVHRGAITLRLSATDERGLHTDTRRTFFLRRDPSLLDGFPVRLGASTEGSPNLADLDGDGVLEIVLGTASGDLLVVRGDGRVDESLSARTDPLPQALRHADASSFLESALDPDAREGIGGVPAIGDLDGDGIPEIVAATWEGGVYAWSRGALVPGFPYRALGRTPDEIDTRHRWDQGFLASPTLYDLDGDGALEILLPGMDQRLHVIDAHGNAWGPYPVEVCHPDLCGLEGRRIIASAAVGDVDADGAVEIGIGTNETLGTSEYGGKAISYLLDARTGAMKSGWPAETSALIPATALLPIVGEGHPSSMAFADVDLDGDLEILDPIMLGQVKVLHHDRTVLHDLSHVADRYGAGSDVEEGCFVQMLTNPAFGDLDLDGRPDAVVGGAGTFYLVSLPLAMVMDYEQVVAAWSGGTGDFLPGWPRRIEDIQFLTAPAIADVSGDGRPEVIEPSGGFLVHAWDGDGHEPEGWPHFTGQWTLASPAAGDIDGDGFVEVVVATRHGYLWAWRTRGRADQALQWASMRHDPRNTGNHATPIDRQEGPPDAPVSEGCCGDGGKSDRSDTAWILLPLALLWRRRRTGKGRESPPSKPSLERAGA